MTEQTKQVPKRRFKEFENSMPWEQLELREVLKINSGRDYKHLDPGDIPVYGTGGYMLSVNDKLSVVDGIGIGRKGTIDKPQYLKAPFWTVDTLFFMTPLSNYDIHFLFSLSQNIKWRQLDESTGVPSLSKVVIEKVVRNFPSYEEQKRIGTFFKHLDELITFHQRKLEKVKALKNAYLSEMFPSEGELVPKRRFAGFTKKWEEKKMSEITDIYDGTHQTPKYTRSGIKFVSVENISTLESTKFISRTAYDNEYSNKQAKKGDVLMTRIGDIGTTRVIETHEPLAYYVTLALLKPKQINSYFLAYLISSPAVQKNIWKRTLHIAFPKKINLSEINQIDLLLPTIDEQAKIGNFFKALDDTITLHERKLEKLQNLKKAYLHEMFV